jgi:hypothetical protein
LSGLEEGLKSIPLLDAQLFPAFARTQTAQKMAEICRFLGHPRTSSEEQMVPEEHSYRAPKRLISPANRQCKIDETINSTNRSSGKGWTSRESAFFALPAAI